MIKKYNLKPIGWMVGALKDARIAGKKLPKWLQEKSQKEFDEACQKKTTNPQR